MTTQLQRIRKLKALQIKNVNYEEDRRRKDHTYCIVIGCENEVDYMIKGNINYYCDEHNPRI
jgi:hypothetical protein|tara:strand:+ start:181 stop:366 length:186 start_codon:yes stop_codon:yes gene_type:complete